MNNLIHFITFFADQKNVRIILQHTKLEASSSKLGIAPQFTFSLKIKHIFIHTYELVHL